MLALVLLVVAAASANVEHMYKSGIPLVYNTAHFGSRHHLRNTVPSVYGHYYSQHHQVNSQNQPLTHNQPIMVTEEVQTHPQQQFFYTTVDSAKPAEIVYQVNQAAVPEHHKETIVYEVASPVHQKETVVIKPVEQVTTADRTQETVIVNPVQTNPLHQKETIIVNPVQTSLDQQKETFFYNTVQTTPEQQKETIVFNPTVEQQKETIVYSPVSTTSHKKHRYVVNPSYTYGQNVHYTPVSHAYYTTFDKTVPVVYKPTTSSHKVQEFMYKPAYTSDKQVHTFKPAYTTSDKQVHIYNPVEATVNKPAETFVTVNTPNTVVQEQVDTMVYTPVETTSGNKFVHSLSGKNTDNKHQYGLYMPVYNKEQTYKPSVSMYKPVDVVYTPTHTSFKKVESQFKPIHSVYNKDVSSIYKNIDSTKKHFDNMYNYEMTNKHFNVMNKDNKHFNSYMYKTTDDMMYTPMVNKHFTMQKNFGTYKPVDTTHKSYNVMYKSFDKFEGKPIKTMYKNFDNTMYKNFDNTMYKNVDSTIVKNIDTIYKPVQNKPFNVIQTVEAVRNPFNIYNVDKVHTVKPAERKYTTFGTYVPSTYSNQAVYGKVHQFNKNIAEKALPEYRFQSVVDTPIGQKVVDTTVDIHNIPETTVTKTFGRTDDIRSVSISDEKHIVA